MAAAAGSWVEKMLQEAQRTSAPSASSVSMSTAVWMVMCSDPAMRAPFSGWAAAYSSRIAISAGISPSAMAISLRPQSASRRSATWKSLAVCGRALITRSFLYEKKGRERRCRVEVLEPGGRRAASVATLLEEGLILPAPPTRAPESRRGRADHRGHDAHRGQPDQVRRQLHRRARRHRADDVGAPHRRQEALAVAGRRRQHAVTRDEGDQTGEGAGDERGGDAEDV